MESSNFFAILLKIELLIQLTKLAIYLQCQKLYIVLSLIKFTNVFYKFTIVDFLQVIAVFIESVLPIMDGTLVAQIK